MSAADFAIFDDSLAVGASSCLLERPLQTLVVRDQASFQTAMAVAEAEARRGRWVALALSYELGRLFEPRGSGRPGGRALATVIVFEHGRRLGSAEVDAFLADRLAAQPAERRFAGVAELRLRRAGFRSGVRRILRYIDAGDCYQVNFTRRLAFRHFGAPLALFAGLRRRQPVRYAAYLETPEANLVSLSPELFVERRGDLLVTRPMKGTASRGSDPEDDFRRRDALAASEKDRAENLMIVDLLRNDLGRLALPGGVRVDSLFEVESYPTLFQMTSTVSAFAPGRSLAEVISALFPCGSVTGAPKIRAMQIIDELEDAPRGIYTGTIGYLAPGGDFRLNVAIRTLELRHDGSGCLGIGSGVVADSVADLEDNEGELKARFLSGYDPGFELIETLRLERAAGRWRYPLIDDHLSRLVASARALGFACNIRAVRWRLADEASRWGATAGPHVRVRLTLAKDGSVRVTSAPLEAPTSWRVAVSPEAIAAGDYLRRHKTTVRLHYDAELARVAGAGCFDALFCNERGDLCEGGRSNVFLRLRGRLYTPPVECGLLPGVMRGRLLRRPRFGVVERRLDLDDLRNADAVYVANALRGLRRVEVDWAV